MREIKFRAWVKYKIDHAWDWAWKESENAKLEYEDTAELRNKFLAEWIAKYGEEKRYEIKEYMTFSDEVSISLSGKITRLINIEVVDIMQGTGIKDKNGKEFFEGDIFVVRTLHDGDEMVWNQSAFNEGGEGAIPQTVIYDAERCCFEFGNSSRVKYCPYDFEIIGNIHEKGKIL